MSGSDSRWAARGAQGRRTRPIYLATVMVLFGTTIGVAAGTPLGSAPMASSSSSVVGGGLAAQDIPLVSPSPFAPVFTVTFTATGLPSGTTWWVNITGGASVNSTGTSLQFGEPKGSYGYTVGSAQNGYVAKHGTFVVRDGSVSRSVKFKETFYKVLALETGLPKGSKWCVMLAGGSTHCSKRASLTFREPNGTYSYNLSTTRSGYVDNIGTFTVSGGLASWTAAFQQVRVFCPMCG